MVKYIYLVLAIVFLTMFCYFLFASRLNRSLNIKKRQIAVATVKNRYPMLMFCSVCCFSLFGILFVAKVASQDYDELKIISNNFEYQEKYLNKELNYYRENNMINNNKYYKSLEDTNNIYFVDQNDIIKINNKKKVSVCSIDKEYIVSSIYQNDNYLVCVAIREKDLRIDIISKYDFTIKNTIIVDGNINNVLIDDDFLNIFISNKATTKSIENGYRQNKKEKVYFDELMYLDFCSFDTILSHLKISFENFEVSNKSICVADFYTLFNEDLYIFSNGFTGVDSNNKFYIFKYSIDKMDILNYRFFNGIVTSTPILLNNRMYFIVYDITSKTNRRLLIDRYLNLVENDSFEVKNLDSFKYLVFGNEYIYINNLVEFNNKYLLSYQVKETVVYIKEYLFDMNASFEYKLLINFDYEEFQITNIFKDDNKIFITYQIDDKYGYNIIDIINEKYGIVENNDNNPYFISVNYLVMKNNNQYQLIEK